jgi:hypothetical protein
MMGVLLVAEVRGFVVEVARKGASSRLASLGMTVKPHPGLPSSLYAFDPGRADDEERRNVLSIVPAAIVSGFAVSAARPSPANAIGPVKISLTPLSYNAVPCPKSKPIPGQMAMRGMRGLCVTVQAKLDEQSPKNLNKVGVYGFVTDGETGDSVLANNPDLSTDAGQFAMIESITSSDEKVGVVRTGIGSAFDSEDASPPATHSCRAALGTILVTIYHRFNSSLLPLCRTRRTCPDSTTGSDL